MIIFRKVFNVVTFLLHLNQQDEFQSVSSIWLTSCQFLTKHQTATDALADRKHRGHLTVVNSLKRKEAIVQVTSSRTGHRCPSHVCSAEEGVVLSEPRYLHCTVMVLEGLRKVYGLWILQIQIQSQRPKDLLGRRRGS